MAWSVCQSLPVLMVLVVTHIPALVPPPENVTVSCQNFETSVRWAYRGVPPQPGFRVETFYSADRPVEAKTEQPYYDLTPVVWKDRWSPAEVYSLRVTAVNGTDESEPSHHSQSITFNKDYWHRADVTCQLDFPAVEVLVREKKVSLSFTNPFHLYDQLSRSRRDHDVFSYQVHVENLEPKDYTCTMEESVCRREFLVQEERQQYCLYLTGEIDDNGDNPTDRRAVHLPFNRTQTTCVRETETPFPLMFVAVMVVFVVAIIAVVAMFCWAKAWKKTPSILPNTLASMLSNPNDRKVFNLPYEKVSQVSAIEPATPTTADTSLEENETEGPSHTLTNHMGSEVSPRPPIGPGPSYELSESRRVQGWGRTGPVEEGVMAEEEEEQEEIHCAYNRRHVEVELEMDPGDVVIGYGPT